MKNKKALGQHWLQNRAILDEIADEAVVLDDSPSEISVSHGATLDSSSPDNSGAKTPETGQKSPLCCLEIGPGLGTLTSSLLKRFDKVVAVEFDENLARNLPKSFPGKNLEVINTDILKFDFSVLKAPFVVVGNIPYYITSPIIEKLLYLPHLPKKIVLLIQKEVALRILSEKKSVLSLMVENRAAVSLGIFVPRTEFTPPPKVDSASLIFKPHPPLVPDEVFNLIRHGFSSPRKKLIHNLSAVASKTQLLETLKTLQISPDARPADLKLADWEKLWDAIFKIQNNLGP